MRTVGMILEQTARTVPEKPIIIFEDQPITYGQFESQVNRLGNGLRALGLKRMRGAKKVESKVRSKALEIIDFLGLLPFRDESAKNLPHGLQRLLGIAIAIAVDPILLLLDEPLTGMNSEETDNTLKIIQKIRDQGITIFIVEHNMQAIMAVCDRIAVLNYGKKLAEGLPKEIQENPDVIEAYLGMEDVDS